MTFSKTLLLFSISILASPSHAGDVFRGHWHGKPTAPIAIQVTDNALVDMCNFKDCFGRKIRTERHGRSFMMLTGKRLWTFTKTPREDAYAAAYWEQTDGNWRILAEARLQPDPAAKSLRNR